MLKIFLIAVMGSIIFGVAYLIIPNDTSENPHQTLKRLQQEAEKAPLADRQKRAQLLAEKVCQRYRGLSELSFTDVTTNHWLKGENDWWPKTARGERLHLAINCSSYYCQISTVTLNDQPTQSRDLTGDWPCVVSIYDHTWIGRDSHQADQFQQKIATGDWFGETWVNRYHCDVVRLNWFDERWFYFVTQDGLVVKWVKIIPCSPGDAYDWQIQVRDFTDIRYQEASVSAAIAVTRLPKTEKE